MLSVPALSVRALLVLSYDALVVALAWWLAYLLRFNFDIPEDFRRGLGMAVSLMLPVNVVVFWVLGLYRGMWRFSSLPDIRQIVIAVGSAAILGDLLLLFWPERLPVPRSTLVLQPLLTILIMSGSRLFYRAAKDGHLFPSDRSEIPGVLVMGAGSAAATLVQALTASGAWNVKGLLDDDRRKRGRMLQGVKVFGALDQIGTLSRQMAVKKVIIAMPDATPGERRRAMKYATDAGLSVLTVPHFSDLLSGKQAVSQVRRVELDDLLGREPVTLDTEGLHGLVTDQIIMVTGAGGSIGSELCRQIAELEPRQLVLFEANEYAMYRMEQEIELRFPQLSLACVVGDARNRARVETTIAEFAPSVIFHAAAYKHVPLMEANAWEAVRNNVLGTWTVAQAAVAAGVKKFVFISTDKAVNPTSVMGATKRLAEMVCQSMQLRAQTRFEIVRFGNVLGSTGSVIPKFREQIARGGPVTVTHPEVIRYFMSISEAAQLVLQAGAIGQGGEIFVLDMGEPVRILDLARDLIRLSGFTEEEIRIEFVGLRPGEKLFEELLADAERTRPTHHPKLRIARAREVDQGWLDEALEWMGSGETRTNDVVRQRLKQWIPEYTPDEVEAQSPPART